MNVTTKNSYVASYYVICGGTIDKVVKTPVPKRFLKQWHFYLSNVPKHAISAVKRGSARCNILILEQVRKRIKKDIYASQ